MGIRPPPFRGFDMRVVQPISVPFSIVSHSRASTGTYIRSTGAFYEAGVNELRINYDRDTKRFAGILIEPRRINLFRNTLASRSGTTLNPAALPTQTISSLSSYAALVVSFYGTGSVTVTSNNYTHVIQGEGANKRVYHTINRTSSSYTFTVSGQVYAANCEGLTFADVEPPTTQSDDEYAYCRPTSWIPTGSSPATREADVLDGYGLIYTEFSDLNPPYNPLTTYNTGDRVLYEELVYESIVDSNLGNQPDTSESAWVFVQTGNKYAMFDLDTGYTSEGTVGDFGPSGQEAGVVVGVRVPTGFGTSCTFVEMGAKSDLLIEGSIGDKVYEQCIVEFSAYDSQRKGGPDNYVNTTGVRDDNLFVSDGSKSVYFDGFTADIISFQLITPETFTGEYYNILDPNSTVSVAEVVIGPTTFIGDTKYGMRVGLIDYSVKETDQFGFTRFVKRGFSKRLDCSVEIDNERVNEVLRVLYDLRATPTVFVGTDDRELSEAALIFGYYRDMNLTIPYFNTAVYNLEVEGLVI